ncbi:MAG: NhaP-type Na+/H+ or K+/H+ antiporter, partial [Planctomycetota bacterium]
MSKSVDRTPLTLPILAVLFGVAIGPDGLAISGLADSGETVGLLAEFTLALVLFYDAARIDLRLLRKNLGVPERLLGPGLILT